MTTLEKLENLRKEAANMAAYMRHTTTRPNEQSGKCDFLTILIKHHKSGLDLKDAWAKTVYETILPVKASFIAPRTFSENADFFSEMQGFRIAAHLSYDLIFAQ